MNNSPIITTATITAIASAMIGLLVAFGVRLTGEQQVAIMTAVSVVGPIIVAVAGHFTTTPLSNPKDRDGNRLTSLANPTDEDGAPLVRAGTNAPTLTQTRAALK